LVDRTSEEQESAYLVVSGIAAGFEEGIINGMEVEKSQGGGGCGFLAFVFIFGGISPVDFARARDGGFIGGVAEAAAGPIATTFGIYHFRFDAAVAAMGTSTMVLAAGPSGMKGASNWGCVVHIAGGRGTPDSIASTRPWG
jgi:hypothetical protein